jgi:hypothetical protein
MNEEVIKATHKGTLHIADIEMPCFVLNDGRRVISGRGLTAAIGMKGRGQGVARIPTHSRIKPFVDEELETALANPIIFGSGNIPTTAYEATILFQVCNAILNAKDAGVLKTDQELRYARACEIWCVVLQR